ncbi:MAG: phospholipid carrier-dependent glycosyltransferase [bacterium]
MKKAAIALAACFLLVYILPLGVRLLIIPDETRYAEIPREMITTGDWVSPRLAGVRYFEKPVLGYWLTAVSMSCFGENRFASRLPTAVAAGLSALLVFAIARRRGNRAGLLAAAILLSCPLFFAIGVFNVLDGPFTFFTTGTLAFFYLAYSAASARLRICLLAACGVFAGLSFMTKGFLALAVPVVVICPFLAWERRWRDFVTIPWIPALAALLTALPWCVMIAAREPDFWSYFFWVEHIDRFLKPGGAQHPQPLWFFLPVLLGGALPWTLMIPSAAAGIRKSATNDSLFRFSICWLVFPFLFFSASSGKLGTYILPCLPPLAVLLAMGLYNPPDARGRRLFSASSAVAALAAMATLAALVASEYTNALGFRLFEADETSKWLPLAVGFLALALLSGFSSLTKNWHNKLALFCLSPMMLFAASHVSVSRAIDNGRTPERILSANAGLAAENALIVSDDYVGPAVCWFFKRTDILFVGGGGELKMGLSYPDSGKRLLGVEELRDLIATGRDLQHRSLVLIVDCERFSKYRHILPKPDAERVDGGFIVATFTLGQGL